MQKHVQKAIQKVEKLAAGGLENEWDQAADGCHFVLHQLGDAALRAGNPEIVALCQVGYVSVRKAKQILAACLGACESDTFSVKQAAQHLGVSKETSYAACRDGRLPHMRFGRRIVITPEQLSQYRQAGEVELPHLA